MRPPPNETRLQMLALGVAQGLSLAAAAKEASVPETTARRWASNAGFARKVERLRKEIVGRALGRYTQLLLAGTSKLAEVLRTSNDPEVIIKAVRGIVADYIALDTHDVEASTVSALRGRIEPEIADQTP